VQEPPTRYTDGEPAIAFKVVGEGGGLDVVGVPPVLSHVEHTWALQSSAEVATSLAALGRFIQYDRRNVGLSDPVATPYSLDDEVDDLIAVLDAAGVERAAFVAFLAGTPLAALAAARYPGRVVALVLDTPAARQTWAEDYSWAPTPEERQAVTAVERVRWGGGERIVQFAPDWAEEPGAKEWMGRLERLSASPTTMQKLMAYMNETDVRGVLPSIRTPTLVVRRRDDIALDRRHALYVTDRIDGAVLEEMDGRDSLYFAYRDEWLDLVGRFLTGRPPPKPPTRGLAALLFTDIVDSTATMARLGDERWRMLLEQHDAATYSAVTAAGGRIVKRLGDGLFARFDSAADATMAGQDCMNRVEPLGLQLRVGVHIGDCELVGDDLAGRTVHEAARIAALAGPGELLVSDAARGLLAGTDLHTTDRGLHPLKGLDGSYRLWSATPSGISV
jgi:class 3 adenylate cyclase